VNDPDPGLSLRSDPIVEFPDRLWLRDDFAASDEPLAEDVVVRFTNLAFLKGALKRRVWLWCATTLAGLLIGGALYHEYPPAYHATTTVVLTNSPNEDPLTAMETDGALAQSQAVAEHVVNQLGLHQSVGSFIAASSTTVVTDQVLNISVAAPSANAALTRANALAASFLQFRATYVETQQQELVAELNQQVSQAKQRVDSLAKQIAQLSAQPSSPSQSAKLKSLQVQNVDAGNALAQIKQYEVGTLATTKTTTDLMIRESKVLDPATVTAHSRFKTAALYIAGGLFGGLALGVGVVVFGALLSGRLRRRDEVAAAFGAPVRLTIGKLRESGQPLTPNGRAAKSDLDMRRVVTHLRHAVSGSSRGPATLAVAAVDNERIAARAVASVAAFYASDGKHVVVADLSEGSRLARLLGVRGPGIHEVNWNGAQLLATVPGRDEAAPGGPLRDKPAPAMIGQADEALVGACKSADILLTLVTLDPAFASEYLATWATDVVALVTAGRSHEERIHSTGELIRLAGLRLASVVLIGADKSDQSLGVNPSRDELLS
jgi:capsular polysaccharide biosynthesis protein